jgi:hypothetical protein
LLEEIEEELCPQFIGKTPVDTRTVLREVGLADTGESSTGRGFGGELIPG